MRFQATVGILGSKSVARTTGEDINDFGVQLRSWKPLDPGTQVVVKIASLQLIGIGRVRRCTPSGFHYAVGVEFNGPLRRWDLGSSWTVVAA